ncbi:hypothetical protein PsorP6_018871 [Peronosclerospora sorghi]|nr:hypothetical protein PsorP6_018871 [Peronosclerospora sorghi]
MMMDFSGETTITETEKMTMPALFQLRDYIIHPLTVSMKLTVNDGNQKLPITHQELSERVLSRLGMLWLVKAIDSIGDEAWMEFLNRMPKLFKEALSSCLQWSLDVVNRIEQYIVDYRESVVHMMEEKSMYIDAQASIDQISTSLYRQQYLSALSFISFLTIKRRQTRYLKLRPRKIRVKDDPRAWWTYAINAVLLDVRERLAHADWEVLEEKQRRRDRYKNLYLVLEHSHTFAASLVSPDVRLLSEEMERCELDDSEFEMDVKDLIKLRLTLRKEKEKEALSKLQSLHARSAQDAEMSTRSRLWSYATWLTGGGPNSTDSSGHN